MKKFEHEKLEVYRVSIDFVALVDEIVQNLPNDRAYLIEQLQKTSVSITLNIAEGAEEFSKSEKIHFYRMAKRSATECAALIDACLTSKLISDAHFETGRDLLFEIVSMLTKLINRFEERNLKN